MPITRAQYVSFVQAQFVDASLYTFGDTGSTLTTYADDLGNINPVVFGSGSAPRFGSGGPGALPYVGSAGSVFVFPPLSTFPLSAWTIEFWTLNPPSGGGYLIRKVDGGASCGVQIRYDGFSGGMAQFGIDTADGSPVGTVAASINPGTSGWFQFTATGEYQDIDGSVGNWLVRIFTNGVEQGSILVPTVHPTLAFQNYSIWNEAVVAPSAGCYVNDDVTETGTTILARYTALTESGGGGGTGSSKNIRRRQAMSKSQGEAVTFEFNTDDASTAVTMTIKDANQVTRTLRSFERLLIDSVMGTVASGVTRFDIFDDKNNNGSVQAGELIVSCAASSTYFDGGPEGFSVTTGNTPKGIATGAGAIRVTGSARIIAGQSRGTRPNWKESLVPGQ